MSSELEQKFNEALADIEASEQAADNIANQRWEKTKQRIMEKRSEVVERLDLLETIALEKFKPLLKIANYREAKGRGKIKIIKPRWFNYNEYKLEKHIYIISSEAQSISLKLEWNMCVDSGSSLTIKITEGGLVEIEGGGKHSPKLKCNLNDESFEEDLVNNVAKILTMEFGMATDWEYEGEVF